MKSLQTRIIYLLAVILVLAFALISYSFYWQNFHISQTKSRQMARLIARILEKSTAQFERNKKPDFKTILEEISRVGTFTDIKLLSNTGEELYKYQNDSEPDDNVFRLSLPINNRDTCYQCHPAELTRLGVIELGFNQQGFLDIFSLNYAQIFLISVFTLVLALSLGVLILNRFILLPINNLNKTIRQVKDGDLKARVAINQEDELGQLEENFNLLIEQLNEKDKDAKKLQELSDNFNHQLIDRVEKIKHKYNQQLRHHIAANRLSASLITTFDRKQIMELTLGALETEFGFEMMIFCVLAENKRMIEAKMAIGIEREELLRIQFPWESRIFDKLISMGENDKMERAFELLNKENGVEEKFRSVFGENEPFLILPLLAKNQVVGMLALKQAPYSEMEIVELLPSLKMLANQVALAMENTQLYGEINRINVNLAKRVDEISTLNEIGQLLNSILDLDDLLELFIHVITKEMKAEIGSIMLLNKATNDLEIKAAKGLDAATIKNTKIHVGDGISGWVALNREPLLIKDIERDERFARLNKPKYVTKSLLCVPIILKKEVIGVVHINNRLDGGAFNEDDLEFLKTLASQAAISLENAQLYEDLQKNYYDTIKSLVLTIEAKDPYTRGHSQRVTEYVLMIAKALGLPPASLERLESASILHDIGKIGISEYLLLKKGKLTSEEMENIRKHPIIGESIIEPIGFLSDIRPMIRHHHERFDGKGYPDHLEGKNASLEARILSVADAYDAMTSNRPYRKGLSRDEAIRELVRNKGSQFDGEIVDVFIDILKTSRKIN